MQPWRNAWGWAFKPTSNRQGSERVEFSKMGLDPAILKAVTEMGFSQPTPIQEHGIPLLLQGEDLIGQAQTGTGKTAAFGICILEKLFAEGKGKYVEPG